MLDTSPRGVLKALCQPERLPASGPRCAFKFGAKVRSGLTGPREVRVSVRGVPGLPTIISVTCGGGGSTDGQGAGTVGEDSEAREDQLEGVVTDRESHNWNAS